MGGFPLRFVSYLPLYPRMMFSISFFKAKTMESRTAIASMLPKNPPIPAGDIWFSPQIRNKLPKE
jgi:hypothetical protein